jgi:outer membrane PBP1 activator LpoA protein
MPATQPAIPRLLLLFATLLLVAGCATTGDSVPPSVDRADRLLRRGDNAAAAEMYERLAQANPPPARNDLAMAAARAWLAANRADDAQRALSLATTESRAAQALELGMLRAEVSEARGQLEVAWQQVSQVVQPGDPAAASRLLQLRQQIALRSGKPVEAIRAGIERDRIAGSEEARTAARSELLAGLRGAIEGGLRVDLGASNEPLVRGWLEIAQIAAAASRSPLAAESDVARWRSRFPGHPAATIVEREILRPGERLADSRSGTAVSSGPVALLLPLTPREPGGAREKYIADIAMVIRAGFENAFSRLPEADRPQLRVYDTGALGVGAALVNAQSDGAGFIVGPLEKDEVQTAYERRPGALPLLLLNSPPGGGYLGNQVYQYALAPEDEARQIARQIATAGRGHAVVLVPSGEEWGGRVASAFAQELTRDGGAVIAQDSYDSSQIDFAATLNETITAILGIDAARARQQRVQSTIGTNVQFDAYPSPDIDAIFTPGRDPLAVRQIKALLVWYNAGEIPTYITQDGISPDRVSNRDLVDMRLLDMPWVLDTVGPVADLRAATEPEWRSEGADMSRYFAFGYDAATLTMALRRGTAAWPLAGLTGRLQLTAEGRIERGLNWARVARDGSLQPFDPVN